MSPKKHKFACVHTPEALGQLVRDHRKRLKLTLQEVSDTSMLGLRFLSEMERGKENASLGKTLRALQAVGLEVLVLPRADAARVMRTLEAEGDDP
ncbi:MAG: helix-turn-helix domain-containing protein [Xanthomonadales bacterium]|nr:helix-turn-helix domain-containing protein [Xanthomonadales bacterium]